MTAIPFIGRTPNMPGVQETPATPGEGSPLAFLEHGAALDKLPVPVNLGRWLKGAEREVAEAIFKLFLANAYGMDAQAKSSLDTAYKALRPVVAFLRKPPWEWMPSDISAFMTERRAKNDIGHSRQYQYVHYFRQLQTFILEDLPLCNEIHRRFGVQPQAFVTKENSIPLKRKNKKRKHAIVPLTPEEVQRIGDAFDVLIEAAAAAHSKAFLPLCRDKAIFWLLYHFGFRIDEVLKLTINSFQPDPRYPAFGRYAIFAVIGKGDKDRYPHALDPAVAALMDWYLDSVRVQLMLRPNFVPTDPTLLFFSERGGKLSDDQFRRSLRNVARSGGVTKRVHPHLMRHTNTVELIPLLGAEGTQANLGHEHMATTMLYYNRDPDKIGPEMHDAIEAVAAGIRLRDADKENE